MKKDHWVNNPQRSQSNNSILFQSKPTRKELEKIFDIMLESGGSELGIINGEVARREQVGLVVLILVEIHRQPPGAFQS